MPQGLYEAAVNGISSLGETKSKLGIARAMRNYVESGERPRGLRAIAASLKPALSTDRARTSAGMKLDGRCIASDLPE